jgi:hypothetical protein
MANMRVIQITSAHDDAEAAERLSADGAAPLGRCTIDGPAPYHLLVSDAGVALRTLHRDGIAAIEVAPPLPQTSSGVHWWKCWRGALRPNVYLEFRSLHHADVRSRGSLIRIRTNQRPRSEPWRILADAGVDVRCEFHCSLPTGPEVHVLVPDAELAAEELERAGFAACAMDYAGPTIDQGISWWGEWEPALTYANRIQRPILMSFASPRVEQVPGVW